MPSHLRIPRRLRPLPFRAHALTGNPFAEDPCCAYQPAPGERDS